MTSYTYRRKVYYLSGFDHRGATHYYQLYCHHAKQQSESTDYTIHVSELDNKASQENNANISQWQIHFQDETHATHTEYHFLEWDDIIQNHYLPFGFKLYKKTFSAGLHYLTSGFIKKSLKYSKPFAFIFTLTYFVGITAPLLLLSIFALMLSQKISLLTGLISIAILAGLIFQMNKKFNITWLLHGFNFNFDYALKPELLEKRLASFAEDINQAIRSEQYDEVMIVGHCYGSTLMTPLLDLIHLDRSINTLLSIVSLAQTSPLLAWLPQANWYRSQLQNIPYDLLNWTDYSSPADGVCFPKLKLLETVNLKQPEHIELKSPRFFKLFDADKYQKLIRRNKFRIHFQYLLSSQYTTEYDYFKLTAGYQYLKKRTTNQEHDNNTCLNSPCNAFEETPFTGSLHE